MFIDYITQQFSQLDIAQLVAIVVVVFWSYTRLEKRLCGQIDNVETRLYGKIDNLETRLGDQMKNLETRLGDQMKNLETRLGDQMKNLETRLGDQIQKLETKIDKLDEKVTDIDRRVCRLEGAFNNKECCMIKHSDQLKKVE